MKKELTCISCPVGCAMTAEFQPNGSIAVTGNQCSRGAEYARNELVDPRRVVTATCRTGSMAHPRLPVRGSEPCPKERIPAVLQALYGMKVQLPVRLGEAVATIDGVTIVATRSIQA